MKEGANPVRGERGGGEWLTQVPRKILVSFFQSLAREIP